MDYQGSQRFPLCQEHILQDYAIAVKEVSTHRVIQRSFWRAHRRNEKGDIDHSLIPEAIRNWYKSQSDEEDTVSEHESDVELSEMDSVSEHDSCEDESDWCELELYI